MAHEMVYDDKKRTVSEKIEEDSERFYNTKIKSGSFISDINNVIGRNVQMINRYVTKITLYYYHTKTAQKLIKILRRIWNSCMHIPAFNLFVTLLVTCILYLIKYFIEILIILAAGVLSVMILNFLFENSITLFFIGLIPFLLYNSACLSILYAHIQKRQQGIKSSLIDGLTTSNKKFGNLTFLHLLTIFIVCVLIIIFFAFGITLSNLFSFFHLAWTDSFFYLDIVLSWLIFTIALISVICILNNSAYFFVLLDNKSTFDAIVLSWYLFKKYFFYYFLFYLLILLCYVPLLLMNGIVLYESGIILSLLLLMQTCMFISFIIQGFIKTKEEKIFEKKSLKLTATQNTLIIMLFIAGIISYYILAIAFIKIYPAFYQMVEQQEDQNDIAATLLTYTNPTFGYTIDYPNSWNQYQFTKNTVTLFNNYTLNPTGGIWITITVNPIAQTNFSSFYESNPGIITYNTTTTDVTTKVSNFVLQGYNGVEYDYTESENPYNQYNRHYMINKNGIVYDINFLVRSKVVDQDNSVLFNEIIQSFNFTKTQN